MYILFTGCLLFTDYILITNFFFTTENPTMPQAIKYLIIIVFYLFFVKNEEKIGLKNTNRNKNNFLCYTH